ncbi:zinc dependent phospholipase C family protein [Ferrimonas gelatinilytica]|uniref:Phospholipase C/D domain-containing protein n=1 Tax=Ferrimonas gelatinilytica TaxID=1255257 RepID=A0ABP9RV26_9GAMM
MAGFFTHYLALEQAILSKQLNPDIIKLIQQNRMYANWGSIGPDYLYFHPDDWQQVGHVYRLWRDIMGPLSEVMQALHYLSNKTSLPINDLTQGAVDDAKAVILSVKALFFTKLFEYVNERFDMYEKFAPPIYKNPQGDKSNKNGLWWWSDIAHSKSSTDYLRCMWKYASSTHGRTRKELFAYCFGYASHMGVDIIGHPYVNYIVGGPYRLHWRRHAYVEKILDAYLWNQIKNQSVTDSSLHHQFIFDPEKLRQDMPGNLNKMITHCMNSVYNSYGKPVMRSDDVDAMYELYNSWIKGTTHFGMFNLPKPDFDLGDIEESIRDSVKKIIDNITKHNPPLPPNLNPATILAFLIGLVGYIEKLLEAAYEIIKIVVTPASVAVKFILYQVLTLLFDAFKNIQLGLAIKGWLYPRPEWLSQYFSHIIYPQKWPEGGNSIYPYEHWTNGANEQTYHIYHPAAWMASNSSIKINQELPPKEPYIKNTAVDYSAYRNLIFTDSNDVSHAYLLKNSCGVHTISSQCSATSAAIWLMNSLEENGATDIPNFNLDGDRGFLHGPWTASRDNKKSQWKPGDISESCI